MEFEGGTNVPIFGKGKKHQIIGTFKFTKTGFFLSLELIYKGKMTWSLTKEVNFPDGFYLLFTENH